MNLNLFGHELVVDNFASGGGASEGIEQALGRPIVAANFTHERKYMPAPASAVA